MTTIEYFMAHAPAAPEWFCPTMRPKPEAMTPPKNFKQERSLTPEMEQWVIENDKRLNEIQAWNEELRKQIFLQWPLAWANEQMRILRAQTHSDRHNPNAGEVYGPIKPMVQNNCKGEWLNDCPWPECACAAKMQTKSEQPASDSEEPPIKELIEFIQTMKSIEEPMEDHRYEIQMFGYVENALLDMKSMNIQVIKEQRDAYLDQDKQIRKVMGTDENESTFDDVESMVLKYLSMKAWINVVLADDPFANTPRQQSIKEEGIKLISR